MAIHFSTIAWKIPWTEETDWQATVHGVAESDMTERLHFHSMRVGIFKGPFYYCCFGSLKQRMTPPEPASILLSFNQQGMGDAQNRD